MAYVLDTGRLDDDPWITVVGTGGTGGFVAEALCRLFTGRNATIVLVDHDIVEPHNVLRQNFQAADVGGYKSEVLARRLSAAYGGRVLGFSTKPFMAAKGPYGGERYPGIPDNLQANRCLLIGCVDNAEARRQMDACARSGRAKWWIDAGNGQNWGQVLIGNSWYERRPEGLGLDGDVWKLLPAPTAQRPDLLTTVPDTPPDVDCAAALDLVDQDPVINYAMAGLVVQVVRRLVAGICPWMAVYLDMDQGTVNPTYATPENVARVVAAIPKTAGFTTSANGLGGYGYDDDGDENEYYDDEEEDEDEDC